MTEERERLEARQRQLVAERLHAGLAWLEDLERSEDDEALAERALQALGFRDARGRVVEDERVELSGAALARLVRARAEAGWSYADVRPLIRGDRDVPERYEPLGRVVEVRGDLPEIVLDVPVEHRTTIAFEIGGSYREWIVEGELGYVGYPPPVAGAQVWRVRSGRAAGEPA